MENNKKINREEVLLKLLRKSLELSQKEFGEAIGVDKATIYRWENGLTSPHFTFRSLVKLTHLLKKRNQSLETLLEKLEVLEDDKDLV